MRHKAQTLYLRLIVDCCLSFGLVARPERFVAGLMRYLCHYQSVPVGHRATLILLLLLHYYFFMISMFYIYLRYSCGWFAWPTGIIIFCSVPIPMSCN